MNTNKIPSAQDATMDRADENAAFYAWCDSKGLLPHARAARWSGWEARARLAAIPPLCPECQARAAGDDPIGDIQRDAREAKLREFIADAATQPPLRLALPDHEKCRIVIASDDMIDGECQARAAGDDPIGDIQRDAARYRWLREQRNIDTDSGYPTIPWLDIVIDAAIANHERVAGKDGA